MPAAPRWTIQRRFLTPVMSIVVAALAISSGLTAWWSASSARQFEEERLARVVQTLTVRGFPLTEPVLDRMRGLSGADFVVTDRLGLGTAATLAMTPDDRAVLADWFHEPITSEPGARRQIALAGHAYLAERVALDMSSSTADAAWLVVLSPQDHWWTTNRRAILPPLAVGLGACVTLILAIALVARRLSRPIRALGRHASAVADGVFRPLELETGTHELQELVRALNQMVERLARYEDQVRRHERLRTLGQLSGGIAHQLRNAATGARMALELHRRDCAAPSDDEALEILGRQLTLIESYLQRFLTLGRGPSPTNVLRPPETVTLSEVIEGVVGLVHPICRHADVELDCDLPAATLKVSGDPHALEQLLINLVLNAIEAARHPGLSRHAVGVALSQQENQCAVIRVTDTGLGPAEQVSAQIFEPLVSEKPDGTGLGLSVAREIAVAHEGEIAWRRECDESGEGVTCFEVKLPLLSESCHGAIIGCR